MARSKSTFLTYIEYVPLRTLFFVLRSLPFRAATRLSSIVAAAILFLLPKRRRIVVTNISHSFPHLNAVDHERIVAQSVENLGRSIALFARIPRIARTGFAERVEVEGRHYVEDALAKGQGLLLPTAHFGCWVMVGDWLMVKAASAS